MGLINAIRRRANFKGARIHVVSILPRVRNAYNYHSCLVNATLKRYSHQLQFNYNDVCGLVVGTPDVFRTDDVHLTLKGAKMVALAIHNSVVGHGYLGC